MSETSTSSPPSRPNTSSPPRGFFRNRRISQGRKRRARQHMRAVAEHMLETLDEIISLVNGADSSTGVPELDAALVALREVARKIQTMKTNVMGVDILDKHLVSLRDYISQRRQDQPLSADNQIDALSRACQWSEIARQAQEIKSHGRIARFFSRNTASKKLERLIEEIGTSIDQRTPDILGSQGPHATEQDRAVYELMDSGDGVAVFREDTPRMSLSSNPPSSQILADSYTIIYAKNAQYNAGGTDSRRSCLEGTCEGVLNRLYGWIIAACTRTTAMPGNASVFWISGLAGTGKTTIAVTVAEWSDKRRLLAANFFCSRFDVECSDPSLIFPTLSHQLCLFHAPFKEKVAAVLRAKPDIVHAGPLRQFEELIVKPLEAVQETFPTSVVVIDALDECLDKGTTSIILDAIARFIRRIAGLVLFVITGRPERHITALFDKAATTTLQDVTMPLLLHRVEPGLVFTDIRRFLEDGLARVSRLFIVPEGWPATQDVDKLAEMSGGLYIWAATALCFIINHTFCDPVGQLKSLLYPTPTSQHGGNILDLMYAQIVNEAFPSKVSSAVSDRLQSILGAISLAQEPLSVDTLATLIGLSESAVRNALVGLGSVLHIPNNSTDAIHIIHPTFPEFLFASAPIKPTAFCLTAPDHHLAMFYRCMVSMRSLRRNIVDIKSPSAFKSEIVGLERTIEERIPSSLSYACRYWNTHLVNCLGSALIDSSWDVFWEFLHFHYLHWLEACSLLGTLEDAVNAFNTALQACQALGGRFTDFIPLLADYRRFLMSYAACVDLAPLQIYSSALALSPTKSAIRKGYTQEFDQVFVVYYGARSEWAPCLDAFVGHSGQTVFAVAFSLGGDFFVTGGGDYKLKMWRTTTRVMITFFQGHTGNVNCVVFSPDGAYIASGSDDRSVRLWQVSSGQCIQTLNGHTGSATSVAYSADGCRLLSATDGGEVKLWDTADGRCILTLDNTGSIGIWQAGLSPDGDVIACGGGDALRLFGVSSTTGETLDFPNEVQASTFSHDGRYVAARSRRTIRIWTCADKSLVRSIESPDDLSSRLAFSCDNTHITCGTVGGSVHLWDIIMENPSRTFLRYAEGIKDISCSSDGTHFVTAGNSTVCVWDATSSKEFELDQVDPCLATVCGHDGQPIRSVAFSPDGSHFVTGGDDNTAKIWTAACEPTVTLEVDGHRDWVHTVVYSPDGANIATSSYDGAIKVWDLRPGPPGPPRCSQDFRETRNVSTRLLGYLDDGRCVVSTTGVDGLGSLNQSANFLVLQLADNLTPPATVSLGSAYIAYITHGSIHLNCVSQNSSPPFRHPFPKISEAVVTAALSSDDRYLAYATCNKICIWSFLDNSLTSTIAVPQCPHHISFSRDSRTVSCSCDDGSLTLWSVTPGETPRVLRTSGNSGQVNDVSWGSRDLQMVSVGQDGLIHSWRSDVKNMLGAHVLTTPTPLAIFRGDPNSASDSSLFALNELPWNGPIQAVRLIDVTFAWDVLLRSEKAKATRVDGIPHVCSLYRHWECLTGVKRFPWCSPSVAVSQLGDLVAYHTTVRDTIRVYDLHTRSERASLALDEYSTDLCSTAFSPSGLLLVASFRHKAVTIWSVEEEKVVMGHAGWQGVIQTAAFSFNDRLVALGSDVASLRILEIDSGRELQATPSPQKNVVNIMFAADHEQIIAQDQGDNLYVWSISFESGTSALAHALSMSDRSWLRSLALLPEDTGIRLQCNGEAHDIRLWEQGHRSWPIYDVDEDGWVYAKAPHMEQMRRLCWVPFAWRMPLSSDGNVLCLYNRYERKVIGLKFSRLI